MGGKGTTRGAAFLRPARQRERAREADGGLAKAMAGELSAEETAGFLRAAVGELMDMRGRAEARIAGIAGATTNGGAK